MSKNINDQDFKKSAELTLSNTQLVPLSDSEKSEIEKSFQQASDFRQIGEKITSPIDSLISKTAKIIDSDPIMNVSQELKKMNDEVQNVYTKIIDNDGSIMRFAKSVPVLGVLAKKLDSAIDDASFNIKSLEGQISTIFSGFDQSYNSLNTSIDLQKEFLSGIEENVGKVVAYKNFLQEKYSEFEAKYQDVSDENQKIKYEMFLRNVDYFTSNIVVLIGNLEMARKRLLMRLDSATKLSLAMNSSRPIFKTLLSTAMIETSSQKAIDASIEAISVMGKTLDEMSTTLTDKAIDSAKKSDNMTAKPVLSTSVFIENVTKLKNHFDQIESYREEIKLQAEAEKKLFDDAKKQLEGVKLLNAQDQDELTKKLTSGE